MMSLKKYTIIVFIISCVISILVSITIALLLESPISYILCFTSGMIIAHIVFKFVIRHETKIEAIKSKKYAETLAYVTKPNMVLNDIILE